MDKISEIWIIDEGGKPLFNKSVDNKVDPALFGGFLSAIQQFVQSSFQGSKIEKLFLGESKINFLYVKEHKIFVVVRCNKKVKDKEITKNLEKIRDLFVSTFEEELKKTKGDLSEFETFNTVLEENLKEGKVVTRMKNWFDEV